MMLIKLFSSLAVGVLALTMFDVFNAVLGDLAEEYVLPKLYDDTAVEIAGALLYVIRTDISTSRHAELKQKVTAYASLCRLI